MKRTYKRSDERPPLTMTLTRDGDPIDLTGANDVSLYLNDNSGGLHVSGASVTIDDAEAGDVSYDWSVDELDIAEDSYDAEFVIDWTGNDDPQTVPEEGFLQIEIQERLG